MQREARRRGGRGERRIGPSVDVLGTFSRRQTQKCRPCGPLQTFSAQPFGTAGPWLRGEVERPQSPPAVASASSWESNPSYSIRPSTLTRSLEQRLTNMSLYPSIRVCLRCTIFPLFAPLNRVTSGFSYDFLRGTFYSFIVIIVAYGWDGIQRHESTVLVLVHLSNAFPFSTAEPDCKGPQMVDH